MNEDDADQGSGRDTRYAIDDSRGAWWRSGREMIGSRLQSSTSSSSRLSNSRRLSLPITCHTRLYSTANCGSLAIERERADSHSKLQPVKKPNQSLNRLILSHFSTLMHMIRTLPSAAADGDAGLVLTAVAESSKLLPWVMGARKHIRAYLKVLLDLWSSAADSVRIAAFLAVRKLFVAGDDAIKDLCLKVGPWRMTYL